jgi:hypothetical protein
LARLVWVAQQTYSRMLATLVLGWEALLQRFRERTSRPVLDQRRASLIAAERPAEVKALIAQADLCRMPRSCWATGTTTAPDGR